MSVGTQHANVFLQKLNASTRTCLKLFAEITYCHYIFAVLDIRTLVLYVPYLIMCILSTAFVAKSITFSFFVITHCITQMSINREIEYVNGVTQLKQRFGDAFLSRFWQPLPYKYGFPIITNPNNELEREMMRVAELIANPLSHTNRQKRKYLKTLNKIIRTFHIHTTNEKERFATYRYYVIGALNNISLSVSPALKRDWGITFELFGAFYNTSFPYCGLFSDLETNSKCDFHTYRLERDAVILVNPPYTESWIKESCKFIVDVMEKDMNTTIYFVIPIWNKSDRKVLGYPDAYDDLPEIDALKKSKYLVSHNMMNLEFYNGIERKKVNLKDKVHVFVFSNRG